ncbi:DUF2807 domain-containing protein [Flavobacterium zepuense]|uniref:DUF2807 domain-containing protein n=1 Tax=Flavobacterium zepuense TaxID=2593302 RepID=A0A552VAH8_9FLAO|nr:head GIN domain-containing protein [Flavobacterium zepuense]TRW27449.1 DUF2807 domain-containing protein [Flavobacterium zepuense]
MKNLLTITVACFAMLTATAQQQIEASGKTVKTTRQVAEFENLSTNGPFEIILKEGISGKIIIEAPENITDYIITAVTNNTLDISIKEGLIFKPSNKNKVIVHVPFKALNEISLSGSGSIISEKTLASNVKIFLNGSGNINLRLHSPKTEAIVTGAGHIELTGSSDNFTCFVTGSGSINAKELDSNNVNAAVKGSGNLKVLCNKAIKGRISGSGTIAFTGEPAQTDLMKTGTGDFKAF